jgi:hypothetical protein
MGDIIAGLGESGSAMQADHGQPELVRRLISDSAQRFGGLSKEGARVNLFDGRSELEPAQQDLARAFAKRTLLPKLIATVEGLVSAPGASPAETPAAKFQSA